MPDLTPLDAADFQPNTISAIANNAFCNQFINDLEKLAGNPEFGDAQVEGVYSAG